MVPRRRISLRHAAHFVLTFAGLMLSSGVWAESGESNGSDCTRSQHCTELELHVAQECKGNPSASSFDSTYCCPDDPTCKFMIPPKWGQDWSNSDRCNLALQLDQLKKIGNSFVQTHPNDPRNAEVAEYKRWLEMQIARKVPGCAMPARPRLPFEASALALLSIFVPPPSREEALKACTTLQNKHPIFREAVKATTTCRDPSRNTVLKPPYAMKGACPPKEKMQSIGRCAMYVSMAIAQAGCGDARAIYARDFGPALEKVGFEKLWPATDKGPFSFSNFPEGAVFVYDQPGRPGHVEIGGMDSRGRQVFVSDYASEYPVTGEDSPVQQRSRRSPYKLIGVYYKSPARCTGGS